MLREKRSTHAAVFGPTPFNELSQSRASSRGMSFKNARSYLPCLALISRRIAWMRWALSWASPPRLMASATALTSAFAIRSHVPNLRRSSSPAGTLLASDVCCDSTVYTSSVSGSVRRGGSTGYRGRKRARMVGMKKNFIGNSFGYKVQSQWHIEDA